MYGPPFHEKQLVKGQVVEVSTRTPAFYMRGWRPQNRMRTFAFNMHLPKLRIGRLPETNNYLGLTNRLLADNL